MQEAAFLCTSWPRRAFPLMMQYGTSFLRQSAGSQQTSSIGSTSCAMITSFATLFSTKVVTWFSPYFTTWGFFDLASSPDFLDCAISIRRCFLASRVSGMYFLQRRRTAEAWFLSMAMLNWLIAGGTFSLQSMILFIRCRRTYFGHRTKRLRLRLGWMSPPRR